jgi:hypothetical protein
MSKLLYNMMERYEVRAVTGIIILAFVLGCVGYYQMYFVSPDVYFGEDHYFSYLDILYSTLTLYILGAGADPGSNNWPASVQVARLLAPLGLGWAAVRAVMSLLSEQISDYRMGKLKGHVIVMGTGDVAERLISEFSDDHDVIHICPAGAENPESCEGDDILTVRGDTAIAETLEAAQLRYSERVFLASSIESRNRSAAFAIADYLKQGRSFESKIFCHMKLGGTASSVRASREILPLNSERLSMRLFNPMRMAARIIIRDHCPHLKRLPNEGKPPLHVLVVGFAELCQEVVKQLVRVCHYTDCQKIRITVVDGNNHQAWKRFCKETPGLFAVAESTYEDQDPCAIPIERWDGLQGVDRGAFDAAYIAIPDPDESYAIASDARDGLGSGEDPLQVVVCSVGEMNQGSLDSSRGAHDAETNVVFFDLTKSSWTREYICDEKGDDEAKEIHKAYLMERKEQRRKQSNDKEWKAKPADVAWEKLAEYFRDGNRDQADHNLVKKTILEQKGITKEQAVDFKTEHPELFELMSKTEHRRWMASTVIAGFRYGKDRDDDFKRTHPNLQKPELSFNENYAQLGEDIKEYDRVMISKFIETWSVR